VERAEGLARQGVTARGGDTARVINQINGRSDRPVPDQPIDSQPPAVIPRNDEGTIYERQENVLLVVMKVIKLSTAELAEIAG
jgi:hypothetical protein